MSYNDSKKEYFILLIQHGAHKPPIMIPGVQEIRGPRPLMFEIFAGLDKKKVKSEKKYDIPTSYPIIENGRSIHC